MLELDDRVDDAEELWWKIQSDVIDGELNGVGDEHRIVPVPDVKSIEVQPPHHLLDALQRGPGTGRDSEHGRSRTSIASKQVTDLGHGMTTCRVMRLIEDQEVQLTQVDPRGDRVVANDLRGGETKT